MDSEQNNPKVRTYAEDMSQVIGAGEAGVIKKIIEEEERSEEEKRNLSPESRKNKLYISLGVVFLFLAALALLLVFFKGQGDAVPVPPAAAPLIFVDRSKYVEIGGLSPERIANIFWNEVKSAPPSEVRAVYFTENKKVLGLRAFLRAANSSLVLPAEVFVSDNFMLGAAMGRPLLLL